MYSLFLLNKIWKKPQTFFEAVFFFTLEQSSIPVILTDVKSCFNSTTLLKSRIAALDLPMAKYTVALL